MALGLRYLASGASADALGAIGYVFIGVWAHLELMAGVKLVRRVLGRAGRAYVIVAIAQRFAG